MWSIQVKTAFGLTVAGVVLIAVVVASQRSIDHLIAAADGVAHTHEVVEHTTGIGAGLSAAEAGGRGYIVTGFEEHLRSSEASLEAVGRRVAALWALTQDNAAQQERLRIVEELVGQWSAALRNTIEARRRAGIDGGVAAVRMDRGRQLTVQIRAQLDAMEATERGLLAQRQQAVQQRARYTAVAVIGGITFAIVAAAVVLILFARELRARDRAQAELRSAEGRLQALIDHSPALITVKDLAGRFVLVNRQYERHCHRRAADIIGRTVEDLWPPEFAAVSRANDARVVDSGVPLTVEEVTPEEDGPHTYLSTKFLLRDADNRPHAICLIATDVTERRRLEDLLRQRADEIEDLYDNAPCGYHSLDAEGRCKRINRTALAWLGYEREEVVDQRTFGDLLTAEGAARFAEEYPRFKARGWMRDVEVELARKDGTILPVALSATAIYDEAGNFLRDRCSYFDISERRQMEAVLRQQTAHAEAANKELEAFSYSVSHDLRAPLRHMDGFVSLLRQREGDRLDATSARFLQVIADASAKMGRLIDDLLSFSRTGRAEVRAQRVNLADLIDALWREIAPLSTDRLVRLELGDLPAVQADAALLRVAFGNLLSNAMKYTATRTEALIEVGALAPTNGEVVTYVRDNGVGFDPQYAHKLFGVFQRLHRDEDFEGTGVGLAIVRRIVERHGGRVWAEGAVDAGATFYVSLRAA